MNVLALYDMDRPCRFGNLLRRAAARHRDGLQNGRPPGRRLPGRFRPILRFLSVSGNRRRQSEQGYTEPKFQTHDSTPKSLTARIHSDPLSNRINLVMFIGAAVRAHRLRRT